MWRRRAHLLGVLLIGVSIVAVPSGTIVESYVGGSAVHGSVEDGHYFVNPGHSQPILEVSKGTWRTVYWVERLWPFSAIVPCWIGMFLLAYGKGPDWKPPPDPPKELPEWMVWTCGAGGVFIVVATVLFWYAVRAPWATMLFGWIMICATTATIVWFFSRSLRRMGNRPS